MKLPVGSSRNARQLILMLQDNLHKEHEQWKRYSYGNQGNQVNLVTAAQRNDTVQWFSKLNKHFSFYPETFFLSTTMLDKVLNSVKVRPRYLKCIGIAIFYLAAKTLEEDEVVPSTLRFVQQSGCGCSVAEVLRMERRVLDILGWNLRLVTPLDFLHILHASLLSSVPGMLEGIVHMTPGRLLSVLTRKLELVLLSDHSAQFSPSVLALSIISLELQQFLPHWFTATHIMQLHLQASDDDLICCSDLVSHVLSTQPFPSYTTPTKCKKTRTNSGTPTKKRKVAMDDDDDDNIYEGIKRLYSDDPADTGTTTAVTMATCGEEHRQEETGAAALASLQAVVN